MVSLKHMLALVACSALTFAQSSAEAQGETIVPTASPEEIQKVLNTPVAEAGTAPLVKVDVNTSFPDAEIFGVKLVNGRPTRALFRVVNNEPEPIIVAVATGSLLTLEGVAGAPETPKTLRNLTITKYGTIIQPKTAETLTYSFSTVMNPQDVVLDLKLLVKVRTSIFTLGVFHEGVSIVEAPVSIFDPQIIFLYLVLAGVLGGTVFAIYSVWIKDLLPQKKRGGKGGERAKKSTLGTKTVEPAEQVAVVGADGPAVTTGSKGYDESWIPAGHLNKPSAKRVGGRTKKAA